MALLTIGDIAPDFEVETTEGVIHFHEWIGDGYAVIFSHPKDFTPVCTTELGYMAGLKPEFDNLKDELKEKGKTSRLVFGDNIEDDTLTYALFPQIALNFFENRNDPSAFEPIPQAPVSGENSVEVSRGQGDLGSKDSFYTVEVDGERFGVKVSEGDQIESIAVQPVEDRNVKEPRSSKQTEIRAPLGGSVMKINVSLGDQVKAGDVVVILEAMKMETEIQSAASGKVERILVQEGDAVDMDQLLFLVV